MYDGPSSSIHDNLKGVSYSDHTDYVVNNDQVEQTKLDQHNYNHEYHNPVIWKETTVKDIEEIYKDCFGEDMPKEEELVNDECGYPIEVDISENFDALTDKYLAYRDKCDNLEKKISNMEETITKVDAEKRELEEKIATYRILTIIFGGMVVIPIVLYLMGVRV